ncbi:tetratricopeptide repeat protein [Parahaliea mediterranea]|uniref:Tetratricopeptide repeat protein n=1 Tax=Parahaliea mediterranea TaxID=651086 RepID=A0A939IIJ3_9GAMM|nr:tetratricopeptide repeat protein [Parahaliea mediterranea]MBN7795316.1 tetratricopeptide repeat protein [Parahaliea mediterranea]
MSGLFPAMPRLLIAASLLALLGACATTPEPRGPDTAERQAIKPEAEPPAPPERAIPEDALYPLLVAEFALRRQAYDVALEQYMTLAETLRDRGVSAHATHIAQYLQREPEALAAALLWVELEPGNLEANNTLATLLARDGRTPEALDHLAVIARGGKKANFPIVLNRFRQLDRAEQQQLVAGLESLSDEFPGSASLLLTRALAYDELEDNARALDTLAILFEQSPYQYQALLLEAKLLLEQEDEAPFARIESALEAEPDNNKLRLQYARLLTRSDIAAARGQFEILSARAPRDGDLLFSLALINHEAGDDLTAKAYLRQLLDLGQRTDEAHYYLGRIAEKDGQLQEAVESYMAVTEPDSPDFFSAKGRIGRILLDGGQPERARALFNDLRRDHPDADERLYALEAELLMSAGRASESMALLNRALSELPESTALRYSRSILGEKQGNLALMESDLRTILENDPNNATALNALGYSLANRTQRYQEAHDLIARALELEPEEPAILDSMGWVLYRLGRYDEALPYLERAYRAFPDPEVAAHLGEVLWVSGNAERAREVWRDALEKAPSHEILVSTIQRYDVSMLQSAP